VAVKLAAKAIALRYRTVRKGCADLEKESAGNAEVTLTDISDQRAVTAGWARFRTSWVNAGLMS